MTDHDALVAAICAESDEDTPRLAFADWLEENGDAARAAFVRAQVEFARTPAWEPFAAHFRWRRFDWLTGKAFRRTLPPVDGFHLEWAADPFRRGFGSRLNVRSLVAWEESAPALFARTPVDELHLWGAATLDDWRRFAASPLVAKLRRLHFVAGPNEPLRTLRDTPAAAGVTDLHFRRSSGAGMPFVVEELLASPLGRSVRGLHFRMGYESLDDLIDALHSGDGTRLERLSLDTMGLTAEHVRRLFDGPAVWSLTELNLRGNPLGDDGLRALSDDLRPCIRVLELPGIGPLGRGFEDFISCDRTWQLRRLDLGGNPLTPRAARALSRSWYVADLRSLGLARCGIGERELFHIARAKFWPNLVELDLRDNPVTPAAARHLLDAEVPADLTALVLDGHQLGAGTRNELMRKFGERVVFVSGGE